MIDPERENLVAESLSDFHDRLARGEAPALEDYSSALGDAYRDLLDVVEIERELQSVLEPHPEVRLPRDFGPYTLLRELGRGAVGIVYEAEHRELGRRRAVKVLRAGFDESPDALERFHREAKALARIDHPNIVEIYDAGEVEGRAFYAMAIVEGRTLSELVQEDGPPDPRWLCRELAGVADALHALHETGTYHRDVKPSNIMVDQEGRMVLADFGLARAVGSASLTRSGQALGTPLYMSPEQMRGKNGEVDGRSDVYGLGATLYELLCGRKLFPETDVRVLLNRVLNEQPEDVRKLRPDLPEDCGRIVRKAIEKEQSDRYASAAAMRDDLRAFAEGRPVLGRPVSGLRRFARRHRTGLLAAAAVLLLAFGVLLWKQNQPGTLQLASLPKATVTVDGKLVGQVPQDLEFSPGSHTVKFEREFFRPATASIELAPGKQEPVSVVLKPEKADDPRALQIFQQEVMALESEFALTPALRHRGPSGTEQSALLPTGRVRAEDLDTYYLLLDMDAPDEGYLAFWKIVDGRREEIYREPLAVVEELTIGRIPAEVRTGLKPGDVVRWGYVDEADRGIVGEFQVAPLPEEVDRELTRIRETTREFEPVTRAWVEARLLLEHERPVSAYLALRRVAIRPGDEGAALLPWAWMREALLAADLDGTAWGSEANAATLSFDADAHRAIYGD